MVSRKFSEIKNKPSFSQYNIFYNYEFFTILWISFFSLCFDLFSIIAKEVNQIRNNVVCVVARLVFLFCCALTTGCCKAFQHNFVIEKKSEFYSPYFQTMLFLVTLMQHIPNTHHTWIRHQHKTSISPIIYRCSTHYITPSLLPLPSNKCRGEEIHDFVFFNHWLLSVESPQAGFLNHQK